MDNFIDIDMKQTGLLIKRKIKNAGYTVRQIQDVLCLAGPQAIYRWFRGETIPTVDHLYVLGRILGEHMEDLIVPRCPKMFIILNDGGVPSDRYELHNRHVSKYAELLCV